MESHSKWIAKPTIYKDYEEGRYFTAKNEHAKRREGMIELQNVI